LTEEAHRVPVAGGSLALVLHLPARGRAPLVLACHGLGASKDSDKYLLLGTELAAAGLAVARFDFRGAGESTGLAAEATVSTRIADALAVLDYLGGDPRLDAGRSGLVGSSMGGFIALHVAARRPARPPVVTWNAPASLLALLDGAPEAGAAIGPGLLAEIRQTAFATVPRGVPRVRVIQGARDEVVPPSHARQLLEAAAEPRDLQVIADGDHRLSDERARRQALGLTRDWFAAHL
jgi:alpha-beta hydrolase superfamily lysophospholipase